MAIGFIGLGAIGAPIASRLLAGSEPLVVYDVRAAAMAPFDGKATLAASARDTADRAQIVFGCLAAPEAHRAAILDPNEGVAQRATFIVDPDNVIRFVMVTDLAVGRSVDEVLRVLDALQSDELCPCNWHKGEATLQV